MFGQQASNRTASRRPRAGKTRSLVLWALLAASELCPLQLPLFPFRLGRCLQLWQNSLMTRLWTTRTTWAQRGPGWRTRSYSMSSSERKRRGLWQSPQTIIVSRPVFVKSENLSLYLENEYVSEIHGACLGYLDRSVFVGCRQTRPSHLRPLPNQCCSRRRCHAGGRRIV